VSGELTDLVHRTNDAFQARGIEGWAENWADDILLDLRPTRVPGLGALRGKDECRTAMEDFIGTFENWSIEPVGVEELSDDVALVSYIQRGTARGSDQTAELRYTMLGTAHDDRWSRLVVYLDPDEARAAAEAAG
jgi:ketosteroid isomerase-like protein